MSSLSHKHIKAKDLRRTHIAISKSHTDSSKDKGKHLAALVSKVAIEVSTISPTKGLLDRYKTSEEEEGEVVLIRCTIAITFSTSSKGYKEDLLEDRSRARVLGPRIVPL